MPILGATKAPVRLSIRIAPTAAGHPVGERGRRCLEVLAREAEREALMGAIVHDRWNMSQVAAQLGISRNTLYRKIKRHGISIDRGQDC